jgi:hypothetical protein
MLYSVHRHDNQQVMVTGSSPEPLVAEASAQIMHHRIKNKEAYMDVWCLLGEFVDRGLAPQGSIGELIGRVLSISVMDDAINALTTVCELRYQTPVTVAAYYRALLTDEAWETLRKSTPANSTQLSAKSAKRTFENAFADAYFHFSHYGKANDATPMYDSYAWAIWLRGTAIFFQPNQELSDRATPIYFSRLGAVSPASMSVALDQDKAGQSLLPDNVGIQSAEALGIFSQGKPRPYIAAVHCYALTQDEGITATSSTSYNLPHPKRDQEAPRYQINFTGLAAYRIMTEAIEVAVRRMIDSSKNALFLQHPRKYGVPLVRQMLPVLYTDADSTAWCGGLQEGLG